MSLKAPFPYFGGKSRVAHVVWSYFGRVDNYIEPFFGSGAVLLARPDYDPARDTETVNDLDAHLANFWRATQADPEAVARYADWPVNETDLHARHRWLIGRKPELTAALDADPEWYDAKAAGWWVWGASCWIGSGWCAGGAAPRQAPHLGDAGQGLHRKMPHLGDRARGDAARTNDTPHKRPHLASNKGVVSARDAGAQGGAALDVPRLSGAQGVHRASLEPSHQLPHVGNAGRGGHRAPSAQLPSLGDAGRGVAATGMQGGIYAYFDALAARLRRVRVCCGDWGRVLGPSVTWRHGMTGVFLDPPYAQDSRADVYAHESGVFDAVRDWALANGGNPLLRIALCGYDFEMPDGWTAHRWKAHGGYGSQGTGRGRENASREVIWFSPACVRAQHSFLEAL